jgi:hypothetical protein
MEKHSQRLEIFRLVQDGRISLEEAAQQLAVLDKPDGGEDEVDEPVKAAPAFSVPQEVAVNTSIVETHRPEPEIDAQVFQPEGAPLPFAERPLSDFQASGRNEWWLLAFLPGLVLTLAAASWLYQGAQAGLSWGFWLSFIPFLLGVALMWLGWEIRLARWLHIRIRQRQGAGPGETYLNFPLPTGLVGWGLRHFGHFDSSVQGKDIAELLREFDQAEGAEPLRISVNDPDGDQVEIWVEGPARS